MASVVIKNWDNKTWLSSTNYINSFNKFLIKNIDINSKSKVLDIGTGAGIPGIPLKIIKEEIDLTLVDSNRKKCDFLEMVSSNLDIKMNVVCTRIEELGHKSDHRERYDLCLARAISNISTLNEFALPFVKLSGYACLLYTSPSPRD